MDIHRQGDITMRTMFWVAVAVIVTFSCVVAPSATVQFVKDTTHTAVIDVQDAYGHIAIAINNLTDKDN